MTEQQVQKGNPGQKGATGASGVFSGGTISKSTTISTSSDLKLALQGSGSPYIRFRNGTTDKAFIQMNSNLVHFILQINIKEHHLFLMIVLI